MRRPNTSGQRSRLLSGEAPVRQHERAKRNLLVLLRLIAFSSIEERSHHAPIETSFGTHLRRRGTQRILRAPDCH